MPLAISKAVKSLDVHAELFFRGFLDSLSFGFCFYTFYTSRKILRLAVRCFVLNGFIFAGSYLAFNFLAIPLIFPDEKFKSIYWTIYLIFWLYPLYYLSFLLSSVWYQAIATEQFKKAEPKNSRLT